ncbi:hypothetical protein VC83_06497 [Pseudogymnoascus destructans]|uniref:Uncharacterized protein n=2 Tax=Pseudogymnoascus destructans TaxID=655981 RepID=L8GCQ6_PSED2|nr:uncharacterized protein VC83_06497 [Pseudogymnoascus destructans]ELR09856.1 hypothetical protein GMDG_04336 [Pseudogymnoascus destructans 20631-21]OAF58321.1 hypothetical protein VC83_06497 [Pseudogymnoascus destructans]
MTRLDQLMTRMDQRFEQMNQRFEQVDQRFEQVNQHLTAMNAGMQTLTARLNATQHNTNAQFANYTAHSDTSPLVPLQHYITGEDIPGFPATTGDIGLLNCQMVDTLIEALGGSTEDTLEKKKLRLRRLVGVVSVPFA